MRPVRRGNSENVAPPSNSNASTTTRPLKHRSNSDGSRERSRSLTKRQRVNPPPSAPRATSLISVGGGPRATAAFQAEVDAIRDLLDDFKQIEELGGEYDIRTVIVERKDEGAIGRGNAWGPEQGHGTVNTGAESGRGLLDHARRLSTHIDKNRKRLRSEASHHPVRSVLLDKSLKGGKPVVDRAVLTRAEQGLEEHQAFQQTRAYLPPFYHLEVRSHTSVDAIDVSDPGKPKVKISDSRTGNSKGELSADTVRLNTGTPLCSPITDPAVREHSFVQAMEALKGFLQKKNLLDDAGHLKPGAKLAIGGTGLSAYDALLALNDVMPVFVCDDSPLGYRVDEEAARKYQGAITFISNTPGKWIPPRHAHDPVWRQTTDPLSSIEEQHALFLHNQGEEIFKSWALLVDASVAIAHGMLPDEVRRERMSTQQLLSEQHAGSLESASKTGDEATQTVDGACRQADLSTILGFGMERDIDAAKGRMAALAPKTFDGRSGYLMHRAQLKGITEAGTPMAEDNAALMRRFETMMYYITASPMHVHAAAPMLFEAGVASHLTGSYGQLQAGGGPSPLSFTANDQTQARFDAFIVAPTFNRTAENALESLSGQVKPADARFANLGEVTTNRQVLSKPTAKHKHGRPTGVEDYSLNGKGASVPGSRSKVNVFATDVNNRESAVDVAPGLALRRMAQAHLAAAGFPDPMGVLEQLYLQQLPDEAKHRAEAAGFAPHFDKAMNKALLLEVAQQGADGDAQIFKTLADSPSTRSGSSVKMRAALFDTPFRAHVGKDSSVDPQELRRHRALSREYADALARKPVFDPAGHGDYHKRFVDLPLEMHRNVYQAAFALAVLRLTA